MDTESHCQATASSGARCSCPAFEADSDDDQLCECGHDIDDHGVKRDPMTPDEPTRAEPRPSDDGIVSAEGRRRKLVQALRHVSELTEDEVRDALVGTGVTFEALAARIRVAERDARIAALEAEVTRLRDLACRVVAGSARRNPTPSLTMWGRVMHAFRCGSTMAQDLCREFGFDPYTGEKIP